MSNPIITHNNIPLDSCSILLLLHQRAARLCSSAIVFDNSPKISLLQSNFLQSNKWEIKKATKTKEKGRQREPCGEYKGKSMHLKGFERRVGVHQSVYLEAKV